MRRIKSNAEIAAWKIDSIFEKWLSKMADNSEFWKKAYVKFYQAFDSEYYKKGLIFISKNIELFLGEVSEEQKNYYITDMVYSLHRFGCMFDEYFLYNFPNLNTEGRESFITDKIRWSYYSKMNTPEGNEIFNNKKKTYDLFKSFYKRDLVFVSGEEDKNNFIEFVKKHSDFIVKPYNSSGGRGVCKKSVTDEKSIDEIFKELTLNCGGSVCEEIIVQSDKIASFHPSSVNTVRFTTIKDKDGIHLFYPLLRTGVGNAFIDNATAGGIFALIDSESGIVRTVARDEKGNSFLAHPNTGVVYPGFELPEWEKAVSLVKSLATVVEDNHYVGWDIAHTDAGWIMVEGNPRGQMIMMQLFCKTGFKQEIENYIKNI